LKNTDQYFAIKIINLNLALKKNLSKDQLNKEIELLVDLGKTTQFIMKIEEYFYDDINL